MSIHRIITSLSILLTFGLSSCSSTRKQPYVPERVPVAKVRKDYLKPVDIRRVRSDEFVKTYHIGRAVSGRNGSTMHESHRVYRLEKPSRWNLARDQPPLASTGPVNRVVDSAFTPAPESQAIRAELNRQRDITGDLERSNNEMNAVVATARTMLSDSSKSAELVGALNQRIEKLQTENEALRRVGTSSDHAAGPTPEKPADALRQWGAGLNAKPSDKEGTVSE